MTPTFLFLTFLRTTSLNLVIWCSSLCFFAAVFFGLLVHLRGASDIFLTGLVIAVTLLSSALLFSFRFEFMTQHRFRLPADNLGYLFPPAIFEFYVYSSAIIILCFSILLITVNSLFELARMLAKKGK